MTGLVVPPGLMRQAALGEDWVAWLDRAPRLVGDLLAQWELQVDPRLGSAGAGDGMHGFCSWVLPVRTRDGTPAVLKVAFPDDENEHEHLALQHWHGRGSVRLLSADPRRDALLLERLHLRDLASVGYVEAAEIVAGCYADLHVPAPPSLPLLTSYVERWNDGLAGLPRDAPIPRRLVEQAVSLARDLIADPASTGTLVHTDLHDHNVLAADRAPWLVIDPKGVSGDPHYEPAPMLWNRWEEIPAAEVRTWVRRRFHTMVDTAGLNEDRARDWVVVRMLHNAFWTVDDAQRLDRPLDASGHAWVTRCITVAKAVQD